MICANFTVDRLVKLHEFYQIDFNNWYNASDSDSDDDSTDLNRPLPQISSIRDAAQKKPKEAVMALFSHLGLSYHVFDDQIQESTTAYLERKRVKEHKNENEGEYKIPKQRYVGRDGVSPLGSPTDDNTSTTQSASSIDRG